MRYVIPKFPGMNSIPDFEERVSKAVKLHNGFAVKWARKHGVLTFFMGSERFETYESLSMALEGIHKCCVAWGYDRLDAGSTSVGLISKAG